MKRVRCFAELPAGLAAVSLRLHGGPYCRPPISRQGAKTGYAEVILAALGLRSGQGADCYVWAEADPDVAALLRAYPDAALLRRIAEIIRGWAGEEPRALWERLRAERKARGPATPAHDTASWLIEGQWSFRRCEPDSGFNPGVSTGEAWNADAATTAARCTQLAEYAVGSWLITAARTMPQAQARGATDGDFLPRIAPSGVVRYAPDAPAPGMDALARSGGWPPVAVLPRIPEAAELAAALGTPGDLEGVVVYMDPPYSGRAGFTYDLPRSEVVRLATGYAAIGARVGVQEAEVVSDLGWPAADLTPSSYRSPRPLRRERREMLMVSPC